MSDTPRTDALEKAQFRRITCSADDPTRVLGAACNEMADLARELERELNQWADLSRSAVADVARLTCENAELRAGHDALAQNAAREIAHLRSVLDMADDHLALVEGMAHGAIGNEITAARGLIAEALTPPSA